MAEEYDLIAVGRISVDLFAQELNTSFAEPQTFTKSIGGSPTNVAIATARLGLKSAIITKVGVDALGGYVKNKLTEYGVDTSFVNAAESGLTPVVLASQDPPEDPKIIFHRQPSAPDTQLLTSDLDEQSLINAKNFWVSACALSSGSTAESISQWLEVRAKKTETIIDLDYRPLFWKNPEQACVAIAAALELCTIAIGNIAECEIAIGIKDPQDAASEFLNRGISLAIIKMGGNGVLLASQNERILVPPLPIKLVCGLGAGDAFGGALIYGLSKGWGLQEIGEFANAAGAYLASELMCSDAMPTEAQLRKFITKFALTEGSAN
jgi:5-dehydro-2-deoxygluconokinase